MSHDEYLTLDRESMKRAVVSGDVQNAAGAAGREDLRRPAMMAMVNGSEWPLEEGATLSRLLASMGLQPGMIVVELNGRVLSRSDFGRCGVADGDRLEIVRFVGGG